MLIVVSLTCDRNVNELLNTLDELDETELFIRPFLNFLLQIKWRERNFPTC